MQRLGANLSKANRNDEVYKRK